VADNERRLVTPDEMMAAGIEMMLDGYMPRCEEDWEMLINFFATNADPTIARSLCRLMKLIYDIPLSDDVIDQIVRFQIAKYN
jgi:hypothetical protein